MKNLLMLTLLSLTFQPAFAHHVVDEVTANNKIVISKDYEQKIVGDKVITYKINNKRPGLSEQVIGEHALPKVGDKVKIYRTTFKFSDTKDKRIKSMSRELVGTATLVSPDLSGDSREVAVFGSNKRSKVEFKSQEYSPEEISSIKQSSLVAVPDNGIVVKRFDSIEF